MYTWGSCHLQRSVNVVLENLNRHITGIITGIILVYNKNNPECYIFRANLYLYQNNLGFFEQNFMCIFALSNSFFIILPSFFINLGLWSKMLLRQLGFMVANLLLLICYKNCFFQSRVASNDYPRAMKYLVNKDKNLETLQKMCIFVYSLILQIFDISTILHFFLFATFTCTISFQK